MSDFKFTITLEVTGTANFVHFMNALMRMMKKLDKLGVKVVIK